MAMFRNAGRLGMANPFSQRLLEDFAQPQAARPFGAGGRRGKAMPFNVTGQPERTPEGLINRPSPVYNRPAFTPPPTPISFVSGLPQVTDFQSEAPATAGPATLGNPFDFASVMGENTVPKMNAEQYLRGPLPTGQGIRSEEDSLAGTGQMPVGNNIPSDQDPYATSVLQQQTGLDPLTKQLLFGLDGQGGFIPGAMQAAERTFFDEEGRPVVVPQEIAGFTPDQLRAQQLARDLVGVQSPYLQRSEDAYRTGISQLQSGLGEQDRLARQATGTFLGRLGETDRIQRGATDEFGRRLGDIERFGGQVYDRFGADVSDMVGTARGAADEFGQRLGDVERLGGQVYDRFGRDISDVVGTAAGTVGRLGERLGESGDLLRQTTGAFDPSMTEQFYDPFEERVVQQTISDALEAGDKADISQRARDIARGGESAFGSRARLGAEERREALGRGLGEALAGIRSRGFGQAQRAAMGEFGRQQQARRAAASGLAGLAGQQYGAGRDFTSTLGGAAGQRLAAGTGYGSLLSGLGAQQLASQQRLAGTLGSAAGQRLSAGTGFGNLLSGIAGQQLGSQRQLAAGLGQTAGQGLQARTGLGSTLGQIGAQRLGAQQGYGGFLSGLGSQAQQAGLTDINTLAGMGGQQQQLSQAQMDAIRANAMQAQQAPLAQYQALLPFIQTAPAGQFQTQTTFAPRPSPLQAGLATGLGTLGALGNFFGGTQRGGFGYAA
jgi:hypothetical protein